MKEVITILMTMTSIEPLIALEHCALPGEEFTVGETLAVSARQGEQCLHAAGDPARVFVTATRRSDELALLPRCAFADMPPMLLACLRMLGMAKGGAVGEGAPIDCDQYADRVHGLQHAWCTARYVQQHGLGPVEDTTHALLRLASEVRALRDTLFELDNTAGVSTARVSAARQRLEQALSGVDAFERTLPAGVRVKRLDDPRGGSLELQCPQTGRTHHLAGLSLAWAMPATLNWTAVGRPRAKAACSASPGETTKAALQPRKKTFVDPEVVEALTTAVASGHELTIGNQLTPSAYAKVKKLLGSLGGRWNSKRQAHVFERDATEVLVHIMGGSITTDRDWEFFATPQPLVQQMLRRAGLQPGWRVREPSAGQGAIALAAAQIVGIDNVLCTEAMPRNAQRLRELGFKVNETDFLLEQPQPLWDAILMNPPFSNHQDARHITHALGFLKPRGVLVAIASPAWQRAHTEVPTQFRALLDELDAEVEDISAGAFRESGTDVATVTITLRAPPPAEQPVKPANAPTPIQAPKVRAPSGLAPDLLSLSLFDD